MVITAEHSTQQWWVRPTSSKEWMNLWECTENESKQMRDQRDGSRRTTRTFTKSLGADCDQDLSPRRSCWLRRTEDLTVWKSISTALPIQQSRRKWNSPNRSSHNNSKISHENYPNKRAGNVTSDHTYPRRPKYWSTISQGWTRMINSLQHPGSSQSSMKLGSWKENSYAEDHRNIQHSGTRNIHAPTSPKPFSFRRWKTNQTPALHQ